MPFLLVFTPLRYVSTWKYTQGTSMPYLYRCKHSQGSLFYLLTGWIILLGFGTHSCIAWQILQRFTSALLLLVYYRLLLPHFLSYPDLDIRHSCRTSFVQRMWVKMMPVTLGQKHFITGAQLSSLSPLLPWLLWMPVVAHRRTVLTPPHGGHLSWWVASVHSRSCRCK